MGMGHANWRCVADSWPTHGQHSTLLSILFSSPPMQPGREINRGFKATEYYLLWSRTRGFPISSPSQILDKLFASSCTVYKYSHSITGAQLQEAHLNMVQFIEVFENLYYQQCID